MLFSLELDTNKCSLNVIADVDTRGNAILLAHKWAVVNLKWSVDLTTNVVRVRVREVNIHKPSLDGRIKTHLGNIIFNDFKNSKYLTQEENVKLKEYRSDIEKAIISIKEDIVKEMKYNEPIEDKKPVEHFFREYVSSLFISAQIFTIGEVIRRARFGNLQKIHGIGPEIEAEVSDILANYLKG